MFKRLKLKKFQSHDESELELSEGLNTIIGTSDSGKSSFIRAFRLISDNKPDGDAFVSNDLRNDKDKLTGNAEVELETDDALITRAKGKVNTYGLNGKKAAAFGRGGVPDDVKEALKMNEINYQAQSDNFFLFQASSAEVMRKLNSFVNLELIDTVLTNANKEIRKLNADIKYKTSEIESLNERISAFDTVEDLEKAVIHVRELYSAVESDLVTVKNLETAVERLVIIEKELESSKNITRIERKLERITKLSEENTEDNSSIEVLTDLLEQFTDVTVRISTLSEVLKLENQVKELEIKIKDISKEEIQLEDLTKLLNSYTLNEESMKVFSGVGSLDVGDLITSITDNEKAEEEVSKLDSLLQSFNTNAETLKNKTRALRKQEREYHKEMPDVCPLCGK